MIRIVDSIGEKYENKEQIISEISKAAKEGIYGVEFRMDILSSLKHNINLEELVNYCRENNLKQIVTNGNYKEAINLGVDFISVEIDKYDEIDNLDKKATNLIVSKHFNKNMPSINILEHFYSKIINRTYSDIVKIAAMAKKSKEMDNIFHIIKHARKEGKNIIGIAMGEKGKLSRIVGPSVYDSFMTFAVIDEDKKTAPGQYTIEEMKEIYRLSGIDINK